MNPEVTLKRINSAMHRGRLLAGMFLLCTLLAGCATAPTEFSGEESFAFETPADTPFGTFASQWQEIHPGQSGLYPLHLGQEAFSLRLGLIDQAQSSIDVQSFLMHDDLAGNLVASKLLEAADRGVRVRVLLDDMYTGGLDTALISVDTHPNIQIRLFNPFPRDSSRAMSYAGDFSRVNRRMHNKSFTADYGIAIVGGRNLGDEYFQTSPDVEFIDEELVAVGPVVKEVSVAFDAYWNSGFAVPVETFADSVRQQPLEATRAETSAFIDEFKGSAHLAVLDDAPIRALLDGTISFNPAVAHIIADHPDKADRKGGTDKSRMADILSEMGRTAEREIIILTPYFVPQSEGVDYFHALAQQGVSIVIITNSLASTNQPAVHSAYAKFRKPLLEAGVELYEINPIPQVTAGASDAPLPGLTLHGKVIIIDRKQVFVGSYNLDPRSADINTEMGLVVNSPELSQNVADTILDVLPLLTYRLVLSQAGHLEWQGPADSGLPPSTKEPQTRFWLRFSTGFIGLFPIDSQL